ncbi:MAG: hypothetical protein ACP5E4_02310, partial [Candidatus Aenigmatarchaeota archaeon]
MNAKLVVLGILMIALSASGVRASEVVSDLTITIDGKQVTDGGVWIKEYAGQSAQEKNLGPSLEVISACKDGNGTPANLVLTLYPAGGTFVKRTFLGDADTEFTLKNLGNFGTYKIEANCTVGNQTSVLSKTFTVHKLEMFFQNSESVSGEIGFSTKFPLIFKSDGSLISEREKFVVKIKDSSHTYLSSIPEYVESVGGGYVDLSIKIPYDVPEGKRTLEVTGTYGDNEVTISKSISIESPIDIELETESISCKANEFCPFEIQLTIDSNGPRPLSEYSPQNFLVGIYRNSDNELFDYPTISRVDCNENTKLCILKLMTDEKIVPGAYTLKISVIDNQLGSSPKYITFSSSYFLQGTVRNADNAAVKSKMTFINKDNGNVVTKEFSGEYLIEILKGMYDITLNFQSGALIADIYNATFDNTLLESAKNINFDSFENKEILTGVHTVRAVVLELGFEFESASLKIPYNNLNVYNEENLDVYVCKNWNFGMRRCNGNWTIVGNSKVNAVADVVEVETGEMSAFLLGERKFLHYNTVGTAEKETGLGGTIPVEGVVLDSDGIEVSGVTITLKTEGFSSKTNTVADGSFLGYVTLPYKEGLFNVDVIAEKDPYVGTTTQIVVKTVKREEISVVLPDAEVAVILGQPKSITLTLVNPGQVDLKDIQININGLSLKNYEIIPATVNILGPGETKDIKLNVNITQEDCGDTCQQYTSVGVEVKAVTQNSIDIKTGGTFIIELKKPGDEALSAQS